MEDYWFSVQYSSLTRSIVNAPLQRTEPVSAMFVTASSTEEAEKIASQLLHRGLVACVNLVPQVRSMYMWKDRLESSQEVLMMIKVRPASVSGLCS
jgi:periplasmic divalent cation tolerance protein